MSPTSWLYQVRNLTNDFFELLFPPVCVNCRKVGNILCADCQSQIPWVEDPICSTCGRIVTKAVSCCAACRQHPLPLKQIRAAVLFDGLIPDTIHQIKYNGVFALAETLGDMMVEAWPRWQSDVDVVMPIPLHSQRQKKRGYNQSELIMRRFCERLNLVQDSQSLRRIRFTPPQVGLNAEDRRSNVRDAFDIMGQSVDGKKILLVDDVCTTGSTLASAAEALLEAGADSVSAYCVARAT